MEYREFAEIPAEVSRSGKFISTREYRVYVAIAFCKEEWTSFLAIQAECGLCARTIVKALKGLTGLGLIEASEKKITSSRDFKVRLADRSRWKFSKAHIAHLREHQ